jgi:phage gp36-like protein
MANAVAIILHALGAEIATGSATGVDIGTRSAVKLTLRVPAVTGTFTVTVETSPDNSVWRALGAFTAVSSAPAVQQLSFDRAERYVRVSWVLGTSARFAVDGEAHQLFAAREDLGTELPATSLSASSTTTIADALIKGSSDVEDALGARYPTPITKVPNSVVQRCAQIAAYLILKHDGFAGAGIDQLVADSYKDAQQWLKDVRDGKLEPVGIAPDPSDDVQTSSGNPLLPDVLTPRLSDNWGDF